MGSHSQLILSRGMIDSERCRVRHLAVDGMGVSYPSRSIEVVLGCQADRDSIIGIVTGPETWRHLQRSTIVSQLEAGKPDSSCKANVHSENMLLQPPPPSFQRGAVQYSLSIFADGLLLFDDVGGVESGSRAQPLAWLSMVSVKLEG